MNNYVVYHLHSSMSNGVTNIDSITKFEEYIEKSEELGMKALGFSEHGSVFSWVKKKQYIEKHGMKYIHAEEFYVTEKLFEYPEIPDDFYEANLGRDAIEVQEELNEYLEKNKTKIRDNYHVVLIALNYKGTKELNRLSSMAFNREDGHYYYVPRITMEEFEKTSDNILVTTACLGGILASGTKEMQQRMLDFLIKNRDRCYLEIQHHFDDMQIHYNQYLVELHKKYDIPLIAGTDTHALNDTHMEGRAILQKAKTIHFDNEDSWDLTFKSYDELVKAYHQQGAIESEYYLQAIENTNVMADRIETFELDYSHKYPKLHDNSLEVFKKKIKEGVIKKGIHKYPNYEEYKKRINYELKTYIHNGAVDFMLLEEDYKSALKKQGVNYGYSRGSVSGSVIAYILGITEVDSIKYNLNFERFMNSERVSLADVDSDWFKGDRWRVREYLFNRKGLHCCDIITFNTIATKGAIKDVGRALDLSIEETQKISNSVDADDNVPQEIVDKYPELFRYVDMVKGTIVSIGNHPAGAVVSPHDVNEAFGTFYSKENKYPISQINMKEIDGLNYVKLDILGLDCVGLIDRTCKYVGIPYLTPDNMDFSDMNVWNDVAEDTTLCFQFESQFAGDYLKDILRESTIKNIKAVNKNFSYIDLMSMANGAIRPAGASYREELSKGIYRDNGHKALNEFLAPTLGYLVYQCQIIEFLNKFCGFTMGEADVVRRHFAKKTGTENDIPIIKDGGYLNEGHYIKGFIATMKEKYGVGKDESEELIKNFLQVIIDASDYLFSKNHSDPYSFLGFAVAYLRYYYPLETCTSALNIYKEDEAKSNEIKKFIRKKNIKIKPMKFRYSRAEYFFDRADNSIYQGLESVKYLNSQIAEELYEVRDKQYSDFIDLLVDIKSMSINSKQLDIIVKLDFFEEFGDPSFLLKQIEIFDTLYNKKQFNYEKLEKINLDRKLAEKYADKVSDKMIKFTDTLPWIKAISPSLEYKPTSVTQRIQWESELLGHISIVVSDAKKNTNYVYDISSNKSVTTIYLYELYTGNMHEIKMWNTAFAKNPVNKNKFIEVLALDKKHKREWNGEIDEKTGKRIYVDTPEMEYWLKSFSEVTL